jgi:HlyD family secretion protein
MRFAGVAVLLLCMLIAGLDYANSQRNPPAAFLTVPVERGSIATAVKANGAVEAVLTVEVSSQLSGRIADVFVNFNDAVKAGQPIAQIDPAIFAARVKEARAALNVAKANVRVQNSAVERAKIAVLSRRYCPLRQECRKTTAALGAQFGLRSRIACSDLRLLNPPLLAEKPANLFGRASGTPASAYSFPLLPVSCPYL